MSSMPQIHGTIANGVDTDNRYEARRTFTGVIRQTNDSASFLAESISSDAMNVWSRTQGLFGEEVLTGKCLQFLASDDAENSQFRMLGKSTEYW